MSREHDYFVYIVTNYERTVLYIGVTNDLTRRIEQHRAGEIEGFTKDYYVDRLVYHEYYRDIRDAILREKQLKGWVRRKKEALIATMNPEWVDLASQFDA